MKSCQARPISGAKIGQDAVYEEGRDGKNQEVKKNPAKCSQMVVKKHKAIWGFNPWKLDILTLSS